MRLEKILQELLLKVDNAKEEKEEYVPSENEQDEVSIIFYGDEEPSDLYEDEPCSCSRNSKCQTKKCDCYLNSRLCVPKCHIGKSCSHSKS